ncbi:MAG: ATP-binding protein [Candidatus Micrarchaeota archaeon]|nr:ATP-binding protein [Candidatus Micrarchaeota archaeon]
MELERQNPHWEGLVELPYAKKRWIWEELLAQLNHPWIVGLFGMRRVGKTVLLKQLIAHLIQQGVPAKNILYFSFDEWGGEFWEVIKAYEKRMGKRVGRSHYLFFDEIQKVEDWQNKLKLLYDSSQPKIFISGSASALLKRKESLAGRLKEIIVEPFSFPEFLYFIDEEWDPALTEKMERLYWQWVKRPFPELVFHDYEGYVESLIEKVIYIDIPRIYKVEETDRLFALVELVRKSPGFLIEYQKLSSLLGLGRNTVARYVKYLEDAFVIRLLYNYSSNPFKSAKKMKKVYPYVPAFSLGDEPHTIETAVAFDLGAQFFYRDKEKREIDFITPVAAVEVKYKNRIRWEELQFLKEYATQSGLKGITITKSKIGEKDGLEFIPYTHLPFSQYARWRVHILRKHAH